MTRGAVQTLTDTATFVVLHPVRSTLRVLGVAKVVVGAVTGQHSAPEATRTPVAVVPPQRTPDPVVPDLEPRPAAEQVPPTEPGESFATEPSALSHADAHGDAPGSLEDWEDELDDGFDVETPVGTTGADVGHNPSTAEADLQQPGTEPLLDPSLTKQVKGDLDRGLRDAQQ